MFYFNQKAEVPLKNSKTSRGPCKGQDLSICQHFRNLSRKTVPLKLIPVIKPLQEDNFPSSICVKINGRVCPLPTPIPTNKPGAEPKRPPRYLPLFLAVFRIRDFLIRIRTTGLHVYNPDPVLYFSGFKDEIFFCFFFVFYLLQVTKSHKTVEIKSFLNFLLVIGVSGSGSIQIITGPGGPKTSGSGSLVLRLIDSPRNCFFFLRIRMFPFSH
jgi:hypothetical protein